MIYYLRNFNLLSFRINADVHWSDSLQYRPIRCGQHRNPADDDPMQDLHLGPEVLPVLILSVSTQRL